MTDLTRDEWFMVFDITIAFIHACDRMPTECEDAVIRREAISLVASDELDDMRFPSVPRVASTRDRRLLGLLDGDLAPEVIV